MNAWWIGVAAGGVLTLLGLVFAVLRLGPQEVTEVEAKGVAVKTSSFATLSFLVGVGVLVWSVGKLADTPPAPEVQPTVRRTNPGVVPPPAVKPTSPSSPDVLFEDRFARALRDEWQVLTGEWRAQGGILKARSPETGFAVVTLDRSLPPNHEVTFRTRLLDGVLAELMLRLANNRYARIYLYEIDQDVVLGSGMFIGFQEEVTPGNSTPEQVQQSLGGGESLVQRPFPVRKNVWYRVAASARGRVYTIRVGGQEIIRYVDAKEQLPAAGTIGLIVNGGRVDFDDVIIRRVA
ncbi:MAG: hypothetical protein M3321_01365 [Actinomycetota bacterium]|nr:hypothetical protein [Actinomycetota bacterium]